MSLRRRPPGHCNLFYSNITVNPLVPLFSPFLLTAGQQHEREEGHRAWHCDVDVGCIAPGPLTLYICPVCAQKKVHDLCWPKVPGAEEASLSRVCSRQCLEHHLKTGEALYPAQHPPADASRTGKAPARESRGKKRAGGAGEKKEKDELGVEPNKRAKHEGQEFQVTKNACTFCAYKTLKERVDKEAGGQDILACGTLVGNKRYRALMSQAALHGDKLDVRRFNNRPPVRLQSRAFVLQRVESLKADFVAAHMGPAVVVIADTGAWDVGTKQQVLAAAELCRQWEEGNPEPLVEEFAKADGSEPAVHAFTLVGNHSTAALCQLVDRLDPYRAAYIFFASQLKKDQFNFIARHENEVALQRAEGTASYMGFGHTLNVIPFIHRIHESFGSPPIAAGGSGDPQYLAFKAHLNR